MLFRQQNLVMVALEETGTIYYEAIIMESFCCKEIRMK